MDLLCKLREICKKKYNSTKDKKYDLINNLLNDDECFFKIDYDTAICILKDLDIDNVDETYFQLISPKSYEECTGLFRIKS